MRTESADEFFQAAVSEPTWKKEAELVTARKYQSLLRVLKDNLEDVKAYRVGEINMSVYVVGQSASGSWMGVSTRVVET